MEYNLEKEVWYSKEALELNPPRIDNFEKYLSKGIGKRVKKIREDCKLTQEAMYESAAYRIGLIENGKYDTKSKKRYSSFITETILASIIESANEVEVVNRKKDSLLPEKITRFWIVFGNEQDLNEFMKRMYDNFCLQILSDEPNSEQANIIQDLFYADASFSLVYGQAKLEHRDINEKPTEKERRALVDAINYTWNIISEKVVEAFREAFDTNDQLSDYYLGNSRLIDKHIDEWCREILTPYLNKKREELKNDSIANIGFSVHSVMEMLSQKRNIDKKYVLNKFDNNLEFTLSESDKYLLDCAVNLEESQRTYFANLRKNQLETSIAKEFEKLEEKELEGDFIEIGTGNIISFDNSGKTFEELINEAIKTCRNR